MTNMELKPARVFEQFAKINQIPRPSKHEEKMIEFISDKYQIKKIEFESTGKNESVKTLLSESFPNATIVKQRNPLTSHSRQTIKQTKI